MVCSSNEQKHFISSRGTFLTFPVQPAGGTHTLYLSSGQRAYIFLLSVFCCFLGVLYRSTLCRGHCCQRVCSCFVYFFFWILCFFFVLFNFCALNFYVKINLILAICFLFSRHYFLTSVRAVLCHGDSGRRACVTALKSYGVATKVSINTYKHILLYKYVHTNIHIYSIHIHT